MFALLAPLALSACGGATSARWRTFPVIDVVAARPLLNEVPYDQPFVFVDASVLFTGITSRDTSEYQREGARRIRETIAVPLATLGWVESDSARARFRIAVLHVDGPSAQWQEVDQASSSASSCWLATSRGRLHRGFAIERLSDGAIFSRVHRGGALDAATADAYLGRELMRLVLLQHPGRDASPVSRPPAGALQCGIVGDERDRTTTTTRPPPVTPQPVPSAPATRRP